MSDTPTLEMAECMGFCGGVQRAIRLFNDTQSCTAPGTPLYVLHELVHNRGVTADMQRRGAHFINHPQELPMGATVLIGAHGLPPADEAVLTQRAGKVIDATCPLVKRVQAAAAALSPEDQLVFHGVAGHPEAAGILGYAGTPHCHVVSAIQDVLSLPHLQQPVLLSQTTLNHTHTDQLFQALQQRFPNTRRLGAICQASHRRQQAVEKLCQHCDALVIVGSAHSSNANRLREIGVASGILSCLADTPEQLPPQLFHCRHIGISAGASTPPRQIQEIIDHIAQAMGIASPPPPPAADDDL